MSLESEFEEALWGTMISAQKKGYTPAYFIRMLREHGGVGTARLLLASPHAQAGLNKLWELHLLNESMEAVVVQERFKSLFTQEELAEAKRRLDELTQP